MNSEKETRLRGTPVSEGIAIGIPFFLSYIQEEVIPEFPITIGEVDNEIDRYRRALFSSREDLERLQCNLLGEGSADAVNIIDTHIQMLQDPLITTHMEDKIRQMRQNTESVFRSVLHEYQSRFSENKDTFFQERLVDVMDVSKRILGHLHHKQRISLSDVPPNSIICARELVPSDTAAVHATHVSAFLTQIGGGNSHAALIARAKGIPYIANVELHILQNMQAKLVIADGLSGDVIINPHADTIEKYKELQNRLKRQYNLLTKQVNLSSETIDGYEVKVLANVNTISDLEMMHHYGASGVGLFRSEYLFLQNNTLFSSEEEQYSAYKEAIEHSKGLPFAIRVFDVGGDKYPDLYSDFEKEPNPVLGCRGIRFLLRRKEIFKTQLRAVLRASPYGDVRIILPLISDIREVHEAKRLIREVKESLLKQGRAVKEHIPLGCMIEVPSAALVCDSLAAECDFLSIGTNDLVQYTLGVDRSNSRASEFYFPAHPSVIRMIKMIAIECKRQNKPVTICGEVASNPLLIPLILGLGVNEISCAPRYIPIIKRVIRQCNLLDVWQLAERILELSNAAEISQTLVEAYRRIIPDEL